MTYSYLGAIHMHSTYSDGSKDIDYIIKQAKKAGLDWIIITDHNTLEPMKHEGFYDGLCVISGCEITPQHGNHLLAFNIKERINEEIGERNYIDEVHKQDGFCIVAHPDESIYRDNKHKPLRWDDWSIDSFDGLEIWNYLTDWTDRYSVKKNQLWQVLNQHKTATGPTKNVLAWWDRLNNKKENIVPAIGGLDAHAFNIGWHGFYVKTSDYLDYFESLNNQIYTDEPLSKTFQIAKEQILNAIKNAHNIIINKRANNNTNLKCYILSNNKNFSVGNSVKTDKYAKLILKLPVKGTVRVIHNGILVFESETKYLEYDKLKNGKYRIEVYKNKLPWLFTNPICITEMN